MVRWQSSFFCLTLAVKAVIRDRRSSKFGLHQQASKGAAVEVVRQGYRFSLLDPDVLYFGCGLQESNRVSYNARESV